jgi:hypothetical protein
MYVFPIDLSALLFQLCQLGHSEWLSLGIQYGSDHIWQCKALCDGTAHGVQCAHVNIYWGLNTHIIQIESVAKNGCVPKIQITKNLIGVLNFLGW